MHAGGGSADDAVELGRRAGVKAVTGTSRRPPLPPSPARLEGVRLRRRGGASLPRCRAAKTLPSGPIANGSCGGKKPRAAVGELRRRITTRDADPSHSFAGTYRARSRDGTSAASLLLPGQIRATVPSKVCSAGPRVDRKDFLAHDPP